ncbi:MAG: ATP-binding protein [Lachnospiraceae bacterium]|nr:ATP-binding protein [Lachnospiraceae bacterium]
MPLTNEQFDKIAREYEEKRTRARHLREKRLLEIRAAIPAFSELDDAVSQAARDFSSRFSTGTDAPADFRGRFEEISRKRAALLTDAGFPADYLENVYECPVCQDTGFSDGQKCACFRRRETQILYAQSHLESLAQKMRFDTISEQPYSSSPEDLAHFIGARDAAKNFTEHFDEAGKNLLFMGSVGTGKTTLSVCVAGELIRRGYKVLYFSAVSLFELLARQKFARDSEDEPDTLQLDLMTCDLLVIDDLGTELTNAFSVEQLFTLLNERQIRGRKMVISTNLGLDDLQRIYAERIMSRLVSSSMILKLTGSDIRLGEYLS